MVPSLLSSSTKIILYFTVDKADSNFSTILDILFTSLKVGIIIVSIGCTILFLKPFRICSEILFNFSFRIKLNLSLQQTYN